MKGLIIRAPWIDMILAGKKTWEMRTKSTSIRGRIALIKAGSGAVYGTAELVECLAPLNEGQLRLSVDRHGIPDHQIHEALANNWTTPWVLRNVEVFDEPKPYRHPSGAVTWVDLGEAAGEGTPPAEPTLAEGLSPRSGGRPTPTSTWAFPTGGSVKAVATSMQSPKPVTALTDTVVHVGESSVTSAQYVDIPLTQGNISNNHFSLRNALHLLPADAIGGSNSEQLGRAVEVAFQPGASVMTDVDGEKKIFRVRGPVRDFYASSAMTAGDRVRLTRIGERRYQVSKVS